MINEIVKCMATTNDTMPDIQRVQTEHRLKLVKFWEINEGSRILEIGCGQGDTTVVLAYFVGENGLVHGVDIGSPTYGAPINLGEAASYIKESNVGKQVNMEFEIDILSPEVDYPKNTFDYIVLSHSSWYLTSHQELINILKKVRNWGKKLCFAEWSTDIQTMEQYPHLLAVLIQAQYETYKENSHSNIRTLFTPDDVREAAMQAGWNIQSENCIDSPLLQDGKWEVEEVLANIDIEINTNKEMPGKLKALIQSQVSMLEKLYTRERDNVKPLSTYTFTAN